MKYLVVFIFLAFASSLSQGENVASSIDALISSMKQSFSGLSAKRDLWFENYSKMTELTNKDTLELQELLTVSKMAIPMIWSLYAIQILSQKAYLHHIVREEFALTLPYHKEFASPQFPYYHVEATLAMDHLKDFQVHILRDEEAIFTLDVLFEESRLVMGEVHISDRIVLEGDQFPAFRESNPFTINVQVNDDCIFASFWTTKLDPSAPMALPTKYHWCTEHYKVGDSFKVDITGRASESSLSQEVQQDADDTIHPIRLLDFTVYDGVLIQ